MNVCLILNQKLYYLVIPSERSHVKRSELLISGRTVDPLGYQIILLLLCLTTQRDISCTLEKTLYHRLTVLEGCGVQDSVAFVVSESEEVDCFMSFHVVKDTNCIVKLNAFKDAKRCFD